MNTKDASTAQLMRQIEFLSTLSDDDVAKLAQLASVERHEAGTVLFREGDECEHLYLVVTGRVALEMCMPRRGCTRVLTVGAGEVVGFSALLGGHARAAQAIVSEDTVLIEFPAEQIQQLCDDDHDIGYALMNLVSKALLRRLVATRLQMIDVFGDSKAEGPVSS